MFKKNNNCQCNIGTFTEVSTKRFRIHVGDFSIAVPSLEAEHEEAVAMVVGGLAEVVLQRGGLLVEEDVASCYGPGLKGFKVKVIKSLKLNR